MELRTLRYFLVLAQELHFKRAADRLFIVQPALSKQIQDLEKELGVVLFERTKRSVQLTEAGSFFKTHATVLLEQLERMCNETKMVGAGTKGELRIGYVGSCMHTFLPGVLTRLHKKFPLVQTYLSEMVTALQFDAIKTGRLDIAFLRNPPLEPGLEQRVVFSETFSLVLPVAHQLSVRSFKSMKQVASAPFILPTNKDGELYHNLQWSICEDAGFLPHIAHETVHGYTAIKLVESGFGISLLPTSFKKVTQAQVKFIELKTIPQRAEITALWDEQNPNKVLKNFIELLT